MLLHASSFHSFLYSLGTFSAKIMMFHANHQITNWMDPYKIFGCGAIIFRQNRVELPGNTNQNAPKLQGNQYMLHEIPPKLAHQTGMPYL